MPDILEEILFHKREEVSFSKANNRLNLSNVAKPLPFLSNYKKGSIFLIAEIKKASPSRGVIREDFDPLSIAGIYEEGGASAISVLTDEKYFGGSLDNLRRVSEVVSVPCLRKDFVVDPYQIEEGYFYGASAILLIVRALAAKELRDFILLAKDHYMEALVEVHTRDELFLALDAEASLIGVNNRDLSTFETSLGVTASLMEDVPSSCILISESGISSRYNMLYLRGLGVDGFLIGEAFMREDDISLKMKELFF